MDVFIEIRQGYQALVFQERLSEDDVPRFTAELQSWCHALLKPDDKALLIDLEKVVFVASGILRVLLTNARRLQREGRRVVLLNISPEVGDVLRRNGFLELFETCGEISTCTTVGDRLPNKDSALPKLYILAGGSALECAEGDTLGTEGSVGTEWVKNIPGIGVRHVLFYFFEGRWHLNVDQGVTAKTRLDQAWMTPGQTVQLRGPHLLQIGALRLPLQIIGPSPPLQPRRILRWANQFARRIKLLSAQR